MAGLIQRYEMQRYIDDAANAYLYSIPWSTPLKAIADLARAGFDRAAANLLQRVPASRLMEGPPLSLWLSTEFADLLVRQSVAPYQRQVRMALTANEADVAAYVDTLRDPNKFLVYLADPSRLRQTPLQGVSLTGVLARLAPATVARLDERVLRAVRAVGQPYTRRGRDEMLDTLLRLRPDFEEAALDRWRRRGPLIAAAYRTTQVPDEDGAAGADDGDDDGDDDERPRRRARLDGDDDDDGEEPSLMSRVFQHPIGSDDTASHRLVSEYAGMAATFLGGRQRWHRYT